MRVRSESANTAMLDGAACRQQCASVAQNLHCWCRCRLTLGSRQGACGIKTLNQALQLGPVQAQAGAAVRGSRVEGRTTLWSHGEASVASCLPCCRTLRQPYLKLSRHSPCPTNLNTPSSTAGTSRQTAEDAGRSHSQATVPAAAAQYAVSQAKVRPGALRQQQRRAMDARTCGVGQPHCLVSQPRCSGGAGGAGLASPPRRGTGACCNSDAGSAACGRRLLPPGASRSRLGAASGPLAAGLAAQPAPGPPLGCRAQTTWAGREERRQGGAAALLIPASRKDCAGQRRCQLHLGGSSC